MHNKQVKDVLGKEKARGMPHCFHRHQSDDNLWLLLDFRGYDGWGVWLIDCTSYLWVRGNKLTKKQRTAGEGGKGGHMHQVRRLA